MSKPYFDNYEPYKTYKVVFKNEMNGPLVCLMCLVWLN